MKNRHLRQFYDREGLLPPQPEPRDSKSLFHFLMNPNNPEEVNSPRREAVLSQYYKDRAMISEQSRLLRTARQYSQTA